MKKGLAILWLLLAAVMCLAGCGTTVEVQDSTTTGTVTEEVTTTAAVEPLRVVQGGATEYRIVRPDETSDEITAAAMALRAAFKDTYGVEMNLTTDFEKRDFDVTQRYQYEIVIGDTNRDESVQALKQIKYHDTMIAVMGTRVVITGGNDAAVVEAVNAFIAQYVVGTELALDGELCEVVNAEYEKASLTLDGVDISEYTIIYSSKYREAAREVAARIGDVCGTIMTVAGDNTEKTGREIVIGSTKRSGSMTDMAYDSFTVAVKDTDIHITGGSETSIETGCAKLLDALLESEGTAVALADTALVYTLPDREVYIDDISKFALNWELYFDTPDWMLDYDEKYAAMLDPDGRLMSCLHRGDMQLYPENSIEGLISSIMMGADMVEIDPRRTKDGVLILLHDTTLTRTTNFSEMAGKNGLPTSANVADWTYEQLMQLSLKDAAGGSSARVTSYKIPTLEEAFKVCANRIFIRLDVKGDSNGKIFWDYEDDIWPLMTKYKSYNNVIYTWHAAFYSSNYALIRKYNAEQIKLCGRSAIHFMNGSGTATSVLKTIEVSDEIFDPTIRLTDFNLANVSYKTYLANNAAKLMGLKGEVRIYVDAHGTNKSYPENAEGAALYEALNGAGINVLLVNKGYSLCTYIAENYEPTVK